MYQLSNCSKIRGHLCAGGSTGQSGGPGSTGGSTGQTGGASGASGAGSPSSSGPSAGKHFGYGLKADKFISNEGGYRDKVLKDIKDSGVKGILTTENLMKPSNMNDPAKRAQAEKFVKLASENGLEVRGHTLNWHRQGDPGMAALKTGDREAGIKRLDETIGGMTKQFGGGVKTWDVVNEAFNEDGSLRTGGKDPNHSLRVISPDANGKNDGMEMSFKLARQHAPDAKLMYNDFNLESNGKKFGAALDKINDMNSRSDKKLVDGIGFQGHMSASQINDPKFMATMREHIREAKKSGLEVHFTEIDISGDKDITDEAAKLGKLFKEEGVDVAQFWNVNDKNSWLNGRPGGSSPTLNNSDNSRKPAYDAFMNAFK